jgi:DNA-binding transcriptional LysR family regulator
MAYSIEQMQAFVAVVEHKGIAQAARELGKHVSTVREQVNNFEIDTGLTLFERLPRSLIVTPTGMQLYKYAKALLNESDHFEAKIDSMHSGVPDRLTVAIDTSLIDQEIDLLLADILQKYPYLNLKVLNGDTLQVRGWVLSGKADVGLAFAAVMLSKELQVRKAFDFEVVRVIPAQWHLPKDTSERALADKLQLTYSFLAELGLREADLVSHRHMVCNNVHQMLNLIKTGIGWGHLPHFICNSANLNDDFTILNDQFALWSAEVLVKEAASVNPAMQMFIDGMCNFKRR